MPRSPVRKKIRLDPGDIDYKNLSQLRRFMTETGKIVPASVSGLDVRTQRAVGREIKRARQLALLPYVDYKHRN